MAQSSTRPRQRRPPRPRGPQEPVPPPSVPPQPATPAAPVAEEIGAVPTDVFPRLAKVAGAVLGPTTVLTGLLFYFGRMHVTGYFRYLRVNFTVLDLTADDYLVKSADGLFVPLTAAAVIGLLVLWGDRFLVDRMSEDARARVVGVLVPAVAVIGGLLMAVALLELVTGWTPVAGLPWAGGLALAIGVLMVAYAAHLSRAPVPGLGGVRRRATATAVVAEWGFASLLVVIGLFWAVGSYAIDVGRGRAQQTQAELPSAPDAVLYTERSLRLAVAGVTELRCEDPEAAFRFRYDGLKLVLQSGGQYLLLPAGWTRENGTAVLIPRGDGVRLEFAPPGQQRQPVC